MIASSVSILFYFFLLLFLSWQLSLLVLLLTIILFSPSVLLNKYVYSVRKRHTEASNNFQGRMYDTLNALKLITRFSKKQGFGSGCDILTRTSPQETPRASPKGEQEEPRRAQEWDLGSTFGGGVNVLCGTLFAVLPFLASSLVPGVVFGRCSLNFGALWTSNADNKCELPGGGGESPQASSIKEI